MEEHCKYCGIGPHIEGHHCEGTWKARAEMAEREVAELQQRANATLGTVCRLMAEGEELEEERDNLLARAEKAEREVLG